MTNHSKTPYVSPLNPTKTKKKKPFENSKTNPPPSGGAGASEKFQKQQAEKQGHGAANAYGHTEGHRPGEAPVASDSGATNVGQDPSSNNPGTQGIKGEAVSAKPDNAGANMK